jgi:arylsulfatase A-like enzyme/Tfp pilus assembly protein PilF
VAAVVLVAGGLGTYWFTRRATSPVVTQIRPDLNVLLITADTTRADYLGCYGRSDATTPSIDRLAREGTRLARCEACTPMTFPSHCSIMTGTYPLVHGMRRNGVDRLDAANITLATILKAAGFATRAFVASFVLDKRFGLDQGFDTYSDASAVKGANPAAAERPAEEVGADALAALKALASRRFFLWVHFYDPHYPYKSPRGLPNDSPGAYADEITTMDRQIGRLLDELGALGLERKTLVVLVGDHGEGLGEHAEFQHSYLVYEPTLHVPLILRCPETIPAGQVIEPPCRTVDVAPTILEFAGAAIPTRTQGTSLRPLLLGTAKDLDLPAYSESFAAQHELGLSSLRVLHRGHWKYILSSSPELYDLQADPAEARNLIAAQVERAGDMKEQLLAIVASTSPASAGTTTRPALTADDQTRLRSLGYVGSDSTAAEELPAETAGPGLADDNPAKYAAVLGQCLRARELAADKRYAEAEPLFRQVVLALPQAPDPRNALAHALRRLNREDELLAVCEQALAAQPDSGSMRLYYARQLLTRKRFDAGAAQLVDLVAREPRNGEAHLELGHALWALKRPDEARGHYEQAVQLNPQHTGALRTLAMVFAQERRFTEAADLLRQALALDPNSTKLQQDLARVLAEEQRKSQ